MRPPFIALVVMSLLPFRAGVAQEPSANEGCGHPLQATADSQAFALLNEIEEIRVPPPRRQLLARLRNVARLAPLSSRGWLALIQVTKILNLTDEAIPMARESVRRWPHCPLNRLAVAELLAWRSEPAIRAAVEVADSFPNDPYAIADAARILASIGHFRSAAYFFSRALALDSSVVLRHPWLRDEYETTARVRGGLPDLPPEPR